jgi:hypothetical protein
LVVVFIPLSFDKGSAPASTVFNCLWDYSDSKYVIFARNSKNLDTQQFALLREKGQAYLNESKLPDGTYGYLGVEEFITVLGVRKQIPVFKQYPVF